MQKKHHVLLQIQLEHLPRLQKKQFKFREEKKEKVTLVAVVAAALVVEEQD
jgi:hypothetical protein